MATWQAQSSYLEHPPSILGEDQKGEVLEFLSTDVATNLFQLCWLENHGVCAKERPELYHYAGLRGVHGRLEAVALAVTERLLLIHATGARPAEVMGRWYREQGLSLEHVVSSRASVEPFWRAYQDGSVRARLNRDQLLYVLEHDQWHEQVRPERRSSLEPTGVRLAEEEELEALFLASARMHLEETLEDPMRTRPESFRRHVHHRIRSGRTYGWFDEHRRLQFKADLSAVSSFGAQISGVYTPPKERGKGIATRALFDICEELFESGFPRVTLYVNAHNEAARRVYQKVGFEYHTDYQTIFVESAAPNS